MQELESYLPRELASITSLDTAIPKISKDEKLLSIIDHTLKTLPTRHRMFCYDSRKVEFLAPSSVHLVVTSPPYWILKKYNQSAGQLGHIEDYATFLNDLDTIWRKCLEALVPGGRLICVVGDVCLSRRNNKGEHTVVPLHSSIQEHCKALGFSNLAPIIWHKIANATYEVQGNSRFLGKPYEPNGVIKNDIEFILMLRKPGGYRSPTKAKRLLSVVADRNHKLWFQQIWNGLNGASTKKHPAPYPLDLADRLIRMFSFAGDTVLDPFLGSGTTCIAAAKSGRNSIGIELDPGYFQMCVDRFNETTESLFSKPELQLFSTKDIENGKVSKIVE
jgi:DNA modification methylase